LLVEKIGNQMNQDNVFSVSEITSHIKHVMETNLPNMFVEGEISNFTKHGSGHMYFSLKDPGSSIRCVFFRGHNSLLTFRPKVGDKVVCAGKVTVYERSGSYQLNVTRMFLSGVGELQIKFDKLKKKLEAEGLFDEIHKKPIPAFPKKIGVVTSATGAAFQDIKNVITRRFPAEIYLYPATVQGERAAGEVVKGIEFFNQQFPVDLLIIGRGGGSQEDLFCFNDEELARTIFASQIPIISGVGHEIDFTISDFVADLRAPTPSAAAELAVPDREKILQNLALYQRKMKLGVENILNRKKLALQSRDSMLLRYHPEKILQSYQQRLDEATIRLSYRTTDYIKSYRNRLNILSTELKELSPQEAMKRGYSFIRMKKKLLNSVQKLNKGDNLEIILSDGKVQTEIQEISLNEKN